MYESHNQVTCKCTMNLMTSSLSLWSKLAEALLFSGLIQGKGSEAKKQVEFCGDYTSLSKLVRQNAEHT